MKSNSIELRAPVMNVERYAVRNQSASRWSRITLCAAIVLIGSLCPRGSARADGALDLDPEDVRPGLAANYRSLVDRAITLQQVDAKPAFYLGRSSPHPRLPIGPFEVEWSGVLQIQEQSALSFSAFVGGELKIDIDGITLLEGRGTSDRALIAGKQSFSGRPGHYRLKIRYRSLDQVPARLQVFWESPSFAREPLPAWRLGHVATELPATFQGEKLAAHGRREADRLGCVRCHQGAFPALTTPPPGPSLADVGGRLTREWLFAWLDDPAKVRPGARMPALFAVDRRGYVERWLIADLLAGHKGKAPETPAPSGDHRAGRLSFIGIGCGACHFAPDLKREEQPDLDRTPYVALGDRFHAEELAAFLANPRSRYPDGRMPRLPVTPDVARNIAAYLLLWSKPTQSADVAEPTATEIQDVARRLGVHGKEAAANALLAEKGCRSCHTGLGLSQPLDVAIKRTDKHGCLAEQGGPRFRIDAETRNALTAYLSIAPRENYASSFFRRKEQLERAGCIRCHRRDSDRPPPIEVAGSTLAGAYLQTVPYQRTPSLTNPHQKLTRDHVLSTVREGSAGLRGDEYSYRMPAFGADAELLVQSLAEQDGEILDEPDPRVQLAADPTLGTLVGPGLVGVQGYGCISCHVWNGKQLSPPDPGAVGPDLTKVAGRIRRDWFDRFLEAPLRAVPGTPMPAIFERGKPARLSSVLDGDPARQRDALWSYFAQGSRAPAPKAPPPIPVGTPPTGAPPTVAQIPIRLPDGTVVESVAFLYDTNDLLIYDVGECDLRSVFTGGQILRNVQGRIRQFLAAGNPVALDLRARPALSLVRRPGNQEPTAKELRGFELLSDGAILRWDARFGTETIAVRETIRITRDDGGHRVVRDLQPSSPAPAMIELRVRRPKSMRVSLKSSAEAQEARSQSDTLSTIINAKLEDASAQVVYELPPSQPAPAWEGSPILDTTPVEGSLSRPGYRAIAFPRPKTISGEDRIMPVALAANPRDGRVFVMSLKTGELLVLRDPNGNGNGATFEPFSRGLYQDAYSMLAEDDALYVLHRRSLARIPTPSDQAPSRVERIAALPHGIADTYDYPYGVTRNKQGNFVISYAPYANTTLSGSGGAIELRPGEPPREIAYGLRNPLGWCTSTDGEIFFTDNQGEWVAANKLCHVDEGRFYGFPNPAQKEHAKKPLTRATVWVPYGWGRSINGVTCDKSGGKFGPFAGQFFLAEVMFGGAIVRADVEKVNGQYQGACFPFWGKGLLGPVSLAFDLKGRLFVGAITEPGWMTQPDRGALFGIDFTGDTPFEMQTIRARPRGFRIVFTGAVDPMSARDRGSYRVEHYRYEYTGSYGSPELDRTSVPVEQVKLSDDGRSVELTLGPMLADRVYLVSVPGVRSARGAELVFSTGAYTLNEIPKGD